MHGYNNYIGNVIYEVKVIQHEEKEGEPHLKGMHILNRDCITVGFISKT